MSKKKAKPKIKKKSAKKDKKPSIKEALDKIKADLAIERFTKEMENSKDKGKDVKEQKPAEKLEYKGNKITTGESLKGLDRTSMERYYAQLKNHIHKSWTLPPWLEELNLKAKAYVNIDESGRVIQRGVELSSGNEQFDKIMLAAIDQSSPLPEPPLRLKLMLKHRGFVLNFPD